MASSSSLAKGKEPKDEDWLELGLGIGSTYSVSNDHHSPCITNAPSSSFNVISSAHDQLQNNYQQIGLMLGLELRAAAATTTTLTTPTPLGFGINYDIGSSSRHMVGSSSSSSSNYYQRIRSNQLLQYCPADVDDDEDPCYTFDPYCHQNNNDMINNNMMTLWPMDPQELYWRSMPINVDHDDDFHHYNYINYYSTATGRSRTLLSPHQPGLWFTLLSSTNRNGEALPQIPKAYIRVKDENVTVFMVKRYLVRKLGLSNEAEIDICCLGHSLSHTQTLKQVRDSVWLPKLVEYVNSSATSSISFEDHIYNNMPETSLMPLLYQRQSISNSTNL